MENDVLKNKIAPWQEKGRWYHGTYNIATHSFIANESDDFFHEASNYALSVQSSIYYFYVDISKYMLIDSKIIPRGAITATTAANAYKYRISATSNIGHPIGPSAGTGVIDFYAFINTIS